MERVANMVYDKGGTLLAKKTFFISKGEKYNFYKKCSKNGLVSAKKDIKFFHF